MGEWISVKDRVPENGQEVLASGLNYNEGPARHYGVLKYNSGEFAFIDDENGIYDVWEYITHWMSLPEPPNKE